jgi:PAS domain S-box-containing protein
MKASALRPSSHFKLALVPLVASLSALVGAPVLLVGIWLQAPRLIQIWPDFPTTTPAPIIGFLLAGLSLFLARRRLTTRSRLRWARGLAVGPALVGVLVLLEYFVSERFALDRWLEGLSGGAEATASRHDSILAGLALVLLGLALFVLDSPARQTIPWSQLLAIIVANLALLTLFGLAFGGRLRLSLHPALDSGFSLPSTLLTGALALGVLFARPSRGFMAVLSSAGGGGMLARRLLFLPAVLPILFTTISTLGQRAGLLTKEFGSWLALLGYLTTFTCCIWWIGMMVLRTEQERDREAHHFWAVAETAVLGILTFENDSTINYANATAEHLFGSAPGELIGKTLGELIPACGAAAARAQLGEFLTSEKTKSKDRMLHFIGQRFDGSSFPAELSVSSWSAGTQQFLTAIVSDISERTLRERRMQQLNSDLIEANKELEAFSYSVSHDLRAPLRAIDGFSRILMEESAARLDVEHLQYLQDVRQNAQQMGQLIDALLSFARLSRQPLKKHAVRMIDLVHECLDFLEGDESIGKPQIIVHELPSTFADRALLRQVWQNLIDNALKYSRHRQPARVEIGFTSAVNPPAYYVRDNGTGFEMKYAGKLFGVFQRLHRSEEFEGTGVGLAVVQRILHRHGGRIWADAKPNEGATFYFTVGENDETV